MGFRSFWISSIVVLALLPAGVLAQTDDPDAPDLSRDPAARGIADFLFTRGMIQFERGDYAGALPLLERAASTRRDDATYRYFTAVAKLRLGRVDEAVFELQSTLPPSNNRVAEARVRYDLADCYYRKGYLTAARRELRRAIGLDDNDGWTHFYLGLVMLAQGETSLALDALDAGVELAPELRVPGSYYLGIAAYERGQLEESRSNFELAMRMPGVSPGREASSRAWLEFLAEEQRPGGLPRSDIQLELGLERDSNPLRANQNLPGLSTRTDYNAVLKLRAVYRPVLARDGWTVGTVFNGYGQRHEEVSTGDLTSAQGLVHAGWGVDPLGYLHGPLGYARVPVGTQRYGVLLQAALTYFQRDGRGFRRDYEIAASLLMYQPGFGKTQVEVRYDDATFLDVRNSGHSGSRTLLRAGQYFYLKGRPERYVKLALGRTLHSPDVGGLQRDADELLAELALPLAPRWNFFLLGSYGRDQYDTASASFYSIPAIREDEVAEIVAKATLTLTHAGFLTFRYGWLDRAVDALGALSFDKSVATVGYTHYW